LLLGLALTEHRRSIIYRREAAQAASMIERSKEIVGNRPGRYNENLGVWRDLPGDRYVAFKGVKDEGDEKKYQGQPWDLVAFDEADHFLESQVRFLLGWNRTTLEGQRCRAVLCFNPPGSAEGRWLVDFFGPWIDPKHERPAVPGELRYFAMLPDGRTEVERPDGRPFESRGEVITPRSRTFIQAKVQDNPYLMATGYLQQLQSLPEPLRSRLKDGDFSLGIKDDPMQVIKTEHVLAAMRRWKPDGHQNRRLSSVAVDVARGGVDETIVSNRHGHWYAPLDKTPGELTETGGKAAAQLARSLNLPRHPERMHVPVFMDATSVGVAALEAAQALGLHVLPVNLAESSTALDRSGQLSFYNLRAQAWWMMREALEPDARTGAESKIQLPDDRRLLRDLTAPVWELTSSGEIKIENKRDLVKRLGRSPDAGDCVVMNNLGYAGSQGRHKLLEVVAGRPPDPLGWR
jgi:hypothetical protein